MVDSASGMLLPLASIEAPTLIVPAFTAVPMSVRSTLASATAPSTLSRPAPCCSRLAPGSGWAVYCRIALTSDGVSPGFACSSSAAVPATAGAAIEVPLSIIWVSVSFGVISRGSTSTLLNMLPR